MKRGGFAEIRQSLLAEASTAVKMKVFMLLALAAGQVNVHTISIEKEYHTKDVQK